MQLRTLARRAPLAAVLTYLAACGGATGPERAGPPAFLAKAGGDGQTGQVATLAQDSLAVTVTDAQSRPVPNVLVTWSVTSGNGAAAPSTSTTNSGGTARTAFSIGTTAGTNVVTASVSGVTTNVTFTITGTAGPLAQVTANTHSLTLGCGIDTAHVSATPADQFGNVLSGQVNWTSRNPSVATVDANGAVHLVTASGSTYLVASSGTARADSVLVSAGTPVTLNAAQVLTTLPSPAFCVKSTAAGSEFTLVTYFSSDVQGNSTDIEVNGTGLATVGSGANIAAFNLMPPAPNPMLDGSVHPDYAFEYKLRQTERREMPKYVAGARAWYARMQRQGSASFDRVPGSGTAQPSTQSAPAMSTAPLAQQIPATAQVGDLVQLNTNANAYCTNPTMTTARVSAISNTAIVVADTTNPAGGFTDSEYASFAAAMDTLVSPVDTNAFGAPSDIDHNHRVVIFFTKAVNQLTTDPSQGIVLGFYYSRDLLPAVSSQGNCPGSNQAELFYLVVPDPNGTINGGNTFTKTKQNVANIVVGTIGHEYQHLINASRRMYIINSPVVDEETWLNEGLSHIAEELIFYHAAGLTPRQNLGTTALSNAVVWNAFGLYMWGNQGRYQTYLPGTETHGPLGESLGDDDLATRGAVWSFLRYTADQLGPTDGNFWYRLVNSQTSGLTNLQQVMGTDPTPWFRDWATSVYADGAVPGIDPHYTQPSWNWRQIFSLTHGSYSAPIIHTMTNATPVTLTLKTDGVGYLHFAVANGAQALMAVTTSTGGPLPSGVKLTLIRTR
ncbi:MAG TPA: Ig-like domain-containing protein [Gemmatimonadaceae bacterium]|nr:Ig-like domain-containing protein [Gemmatimonadaceae bacterium]